jgi:hypothetical protein
MTECNCDREKKRVIKARLSEYGHSKPENGSVRVMEEVDACSTRVIQAATKAGLNEQEAKKLAKRECGKQGERMEQIS